MSRLLLVLALLPAIVPAASLPRVLFADLEKNFDQRLEGVIPGDAFLLLGDTRGVYLDGFGAVFTAEVNLVNSPTLSPFRRTISKPEVMKVHEKKQQRLAVLKQCMQDTMIGMAAALTEMPAGEQIVVGVSLFYFSWEDTSGLPTQIVMRAERRQLLGARAGQPLPPGVVKVKEL